jgi:hypothetical protein
MVGSYVGRGESGHTVLELAGFTVAGSNVAALKKYGSSCPEFPMKRVTA